MIRSQYAEIYDLRTKTITRMHSTTKLKRFILKIKTRIFGYSVTETEITGSRHVGTIKQLTIKGEPMDVGHCEDGPAIHLTNTVTNEDYYTYMLFGETIQTEEEYNSRIYQLKLSKLGL